MIIRALALPLLALCSFVQAQERVFCWMLS